MISLLRAVATAAAALALLSGARAQEVDGTLGASSALLVRGVALGNARPVLQAGAAVDTVDGWLAGLGVAALRPSTDQGWTTQLYARAGHAFRLDDDWSAQLAATHYAYPFDDYLRSFDRDEFGATLAWRDRVFGSITALRQTHVSPDGHRSGWAADLVLREPLGRVGPVSLALTAGLGHQDLQRRAGFSYDYGHLGASGRVGALQFELARVASDRRAREGFGSAADARWVGSLTVGF
ncbi:MULTISPECIES: hypothetical protein [unclassified Rhizobacter]|uniref:hypothetical protein n=1 Tax=unclassified Rhizobacter TaxID=2640088 RepID=UPI0006FD857D|nr:MULTISPECIES: hypothetical protein [unclassified Rhizobacter]KQU78112.1 hypothetical protein ASC88_20010 [Rhizobacter sp. Root29]KQW15858.1 hypothetical protein ASC98_01230 [Rhizobacter sp. Root1238]KRB24971.1 hypothetical protein ASE08_01945 [Rhizobacter sp. Root16D2]